MSGYKFYTTRVECYLAGLLLILFATLVWSGCQEGINRPILNLVPDTTGQDTTDVGGDPPPYDGHDTYGTSFFDTGNPADVRKLLMTGAAVKFTNGAIFATNSTNTDSLYATCIGGPIEFGASDTVTFVWWVGAVKGGTYKFEYAEDPGNGDIPRVWRSITVRQNTQKFQTAAIIFNFGGTPALYFRFSFKLPQDAVVRITPFRAYGK